MYRDDYASHAQQLLFPAAFFPHFILGCFSENVLEARSSERAE